MRFIAIMFALCAMTLKVDAAEFLSMFENGAEISSYKTTQPRYGEERTAYTVMVFVPEYISRLTRIKAEGSIKIPSNQQVLVVKLNRALQFNTGIYNYSVMTSAFCAVGREFGREPLYPMKISISASEWCGNFYQQLIPNGKGAQRTMHSYFEKEGDRDDYLEAPKNDLYEDNLPVLIREFSGEYLAVNQKKDLNILPSLWESRITHKPLGYEKGYVQKNAETLVFQGKNQETFKWTWQVGSRTVTYWVERDFPHTILKWESSTGDSGELIKTLTVKYWEKHKNSDLGLRSDLGIPIVP